MTTALRITFGVPIAILALAGFSIALLIEWIDELKRSCPHGEDQS